jgi:hypothetical protein
MRPVLDSRHDATPAVPARRAFIGTRRYSMYRWSIFAFVAILAATIAASCGGGGGKTKLILPTGTGTGTGTSTDTSTGTGTVDKINFESYFWPLNEDWKWTFAGNEWYEVDPVVMVNGNETYPMVWVYGAASADVWYFMTDGNGSLLEARFGYKQDDYWDWDPPLVWGIRGMVKDVTITTESTGTEYDFQTGVPTGNTIPAKLEATYLGKESVTVPYGTFSCIKVNYKCYRDGSLEYEDNYWFTWHDGIVKDEIVGVRTLELIDLMSPP